MTLENTIMELLVSYSFDDAKENGVDLTSSYEDEKSKAKRLRQRLISEHPEYKDALIAMIKKDCDQYGITFVESDYI